MMVAARMEVEVVVVVVVVEAGQRVVGLKEVWPLGN